ncbi:hypothetical protein [Flexibacterium corallicola]|uniref:hypothetical protein n=1 Tax=Flexibacterium corallicola TaxID=3037259 RepID=UPI00286EF7B3|nr:hypothetical protein [Pseudovibrio sp. M1P-2-3]
MSNAALALHPEYLIDALPPHLKEEVVHLQDEITAHYLLECLLLKKGIEARVLLTRNRSHYCYLGQEERAKRFAELFHLWSLGFDRVIDEALFADTALRLPKEYELLKQSVRKGSADRSSHSLK